MKGYCGECDKGIEFHRGTIEQMRNKETNVTEIYLVCPWCNEKELITEVKQ